MTGINHYINDALTRFNNQLWTNKSRNFHGMARIDINENIPYIREGNEYKDVLFDDRYDATCFFYEPDERDVESFHFTTQVELVFQIKIGSFTETEEELIEQAYRVLSRTSFTVNSISKDITALAGFEYEKALPDTMRPYFIFRFSNTLNGTQNH